ncbi:hypothetical protein DFQ29_009548 [Apophysomyces sp. BC1021]|nr:hypothetical protein DFQ29_009548 [Apophysomyces sp. BC1021]
MPQSKPESMMNKDQEDTEQVRKEYENMTYDEMSQRMAESYKQLTEMLGHRISTPSATSSDKTDAPVYDIPTGDDLDELADLEDEAKRVKLAKLFSRAASSGDVDRVKQLLDDETLRPLIDIDARDEDGTTPLIYAACFGKTDIAESLLAANAKIDIQDSVGWTALMWATTNNHEALVKILLAHGASSQTRSAKGLTVYDVMTTENQKIVDILPTNPRDSYSSTSSLMARSASSASSTVGDLDFYYQSTPESFDTFLAEDADRRQKLLETAHALAGDDFTDQEDSEDDETLNEEGPNEFFWDKCLPDQMFVFGADDLPSILNMVITDIQLPMQSRLEICVPANVVFLSARFAHYYSSSELLHEVMEGALSRMSEVIKGNAHNVHVLAFWITNFTQLLYYLKKDSGLVIDTAIYQLRLSELISETYTLMINDTEQRIFKVLGPAMLDHEQIPGMEDVNFADDWQRFFRRSNSRRSVMVEGTQMRRNASMPVHGSNELANAISPRSITSLLTSTFIVLQSYEVHPTIIIQALAQFFHYTSCELFNRILTNKKMLNRSKAVQIRMNLSHVEDWIRHNHLPSSLISYFNPTTQLLQLLQCLSQLDDLESFVTTVKKFDALNSLQIKRCVVNYRYEVNEPRLPDEVEKFVIQMATNMVRLKQARQSKSFERIRRSAPPMARAKSMSLHRERSRPESMSNLVGSIMSSVGMSASTSLPPTVPSSPTTDRAPKDKKMEEDEHEPEIESTHETKDSKFMLPFSVPTTAHMVFISGWAPDDSKREKIVVPVIPEEWLEKLDKDS